MSSRSSFSLNADVHGSPRPEAPVVTGQAYEAFVRAIEKLTGLDLASYKPDQLQRRLPTLLARIGVASLGEYATLLARDPDRLREFWDWVGIHVSEFFRDPPVYHWLESQILPDLLNRRSSLQIWSAGCSIGAEPYSLAIVLEETGRTPAYRILATDVSPEVLRLARQGGPYKAEHVRAVSPARLRRWFTSGADGYRVRRELGNAIRFVQHDLFKDRYPVKQDLITCRNVAIYFTTPVRDAVYARLAQALAPGGVLVLGGSEAIAHPRALGLTRLAPSCYQRKE